MPSDTDPGDGVEPSAGSDTDAAAGFGAPQFDLDSSRGVPDSSRVAPDSSRGVPDHRVGRAGSRGGDTLRLVGMVVSGVAVVLGAAYDYLVLGGTEPLAFGWNPTPVDWLFLLSLSVFGWLLVFPLVRDRERAARYGRLLRAEPLRLAAALYLLAFFVAGLVGTVVGNTISEGLDHGYQPPVFFSVPDHVPVQCLGAEAAGRCRGSFQYPLGTDAHGNGLIELVVLGAGVSLRVAFVVGMIAVPLALAVGVIAGYAGGRTDAVLMRYVDVQGTVPAFLVYIVLIYVYGRSLFLLVLVFGLLSWGGIARIVRSEVLQIRTEAYVAAALGQGAGRFRVLRRHVVPNVYDSLAVSATQAIPRILLIEAAISFMLLNDIGVASWGHTATMGLRHQHQFVHTWWISTIPIAFLAMTVLSITVLGDFFRDALDPTAGRPDAETDVDSAIGTEVDHSSGGTEAEPEVDRR
ncbi:peptide/nickel transport system permease protein [Halalkaliarchaeum desulfuricum]|uniref:Peptide/nickel transport system permease protein n=1 Tax=Halalkaliarchaeum desulfuricum TaxID=2055893 RepID=A0A343THQ5_9EURY|nr:ABC transporter permease [Halalkaliarchaeum desulfuricum]AUX08627.1 peptide/nickel transport system permease protein [Halalkaliarchaeum desulfuricum]